MSTLAYYSLWLAGGLVAIAIASAVFARHLGSRVDRRVKAMQLLDALCRYTEWFSAQRRAVFFRSDALDDSPVQEVRAIGEEWFPELSSEAAEIFAVHTRVIAFLGAQQGLRQRDPEAWLECDHDPKFMALWREHLAAVEAAVAKLEWLAGVPQARPGPGTASTA